MFGRERGGGEAKGGKRNVSGFSRNGVTTVNPLEVLDIRRDGVMRQVIHALVKASMKGNLHMLSNDIIPQYIFGCEGEKTKEDAFASMVDEFGRAFAWWTNPDPATKSAEAMALWLNAM